MKIKYFIFICIILFLKTNVNAQAVAKIVFNVSANSSNINTVDILIDNVVVSVDQNGQINSFCANDGGDINYDDNEISGTSISVDYFTDDIWGRNGKLKSIGNLELDYFNNDIWGRNGKLESIGNLKLDYFNNDIWGRNGKLESVGNLKLDYFNNDIWGRNGKLESIGNLKLDYFNNDIWGRNGKLQSIGSLKLDYFVNDVWGRNGKLQSVNGKEHDVYVYINPAKNNTNIKIVKSIE